MDLSEKLQKLRKENNLTQEDLAKKLFVSRTAISKWETGRGMPSIESLQLISKYFDISLDLLLSNEEIIDLAKKENKENIRSLIKRIDILIYVIGTVILISSSQPYPTILFFSLFLMKCLILLKKNKWHSKYR